MAEDIPTLQVYLQPLSRRLWLFSTAARETPSIMAKLSWTLSGDVTAPVGTLIPARRIDLPALRDPSGWR